LKLNRLNENEVDLLDLHYRLRLQALQSVDELVNRTVTKLEDLGLLENTYVIYTSDNGFHLGQHRLPPGKRCPYEEDVNVPLIIRGPGVPEGQTAKIVTSHTDIVPSIVHWAGASSSIDLDGSPIPINGLVVNIQRKFEHAAIEYWGHTLDGASNHELTAYKVIRVIGQDYNLYYSVWCDGSHEVYDMQVCDFNEVTLHLTRVRMTRTK
jgi:N-acetylglucosamine-6-sulfatase